MYVNKTLNRSTESEFLTIQQSDVVIDVDCM